MCVWVLLQDTGETAPKLAEQDRLHYWQNKGEE